MTMPRPCPTPGCWRFQGQCPAHDFRPWARTRSRRQPAGSGWAWGRLRLRILQRDGNRCHWCAGQADVVDHVRGVAAGGTDDEQNLVASCADCNEQRRRQQAGAGRKTKRQGNAGRAALHFLHARRMR
jgi:5-methylcytosine-specific restriction endonuclease McrA